MKRLLLIIQWLVVGGIIVFLVSLLVRDQSRPRRNFDVWNQWDGFIAISYGRISRREDGQNVTQGRLREQLSRLAAAGYETISTEDLLGYLDGRNPLPRKALYLFFEEGQKDSLLFTQPILVDLGFRAAMYVATDQLTSWNRLALRQGDLAKIAANPYWDVDSYGHRAISPIPADSGGRPGYYLTHLRWIASAGRSETTEEFRRRIAEDYDESFRSISRFAGRPPLAYCFFPANTLGISLDEELGLANVEAMKKQYRLAFTREGNAFNGREGDAWNLTRLKVPADWSADRLLGELESSRPRWSDYTVAGQPVSESSPWQSTEGTINVVGTSLNVTAGPAGRGFSWLRGSEEWRDVDFEASVVPSSSAYTAIYFRYRDAGSFVRLTIRREGVRLQEQTGRRLQTLFWKPMDLSGKETLELHVRVKNNRLLAWMNDAPLGDGVFPLAPSDRIGRFALGIAAGEAGDQVLVQDLTLHPTPPYWVEAENYRALPEAMRMEASQVLVGWFRKGFEPPSSEQQATLLAAAAAGVETFLRVEPSAGSAAAGDEKNKGTKLLAILRSPELSGLVSGVVFEDSSEGSEVPYPNDLARNLGQGGIQVGWLGPLSRLEALISLRRQPVADWILLSDKASGENQRISALARWYSPSRILFQTPPAADGAISVYEAKRGAR